MKKIHFIIWSLMTIMVNANLTSCTNETEEILAQNNEIKLTNIIVPASRTANQELQSTQIITNQHVGVTITGAQNTHNNADWKAEANGILTNQENTLYWGDGNINIMAYHPYNSNWTNTEETFTINTDQTSDTNYLNSDLLWVSKTLVSKSSSPIELKFNHMLTKIMVSLQHEDGEAVDVTNSIVSICGTKISATFNLSTGMVTPSGSVVDIKAAQAASAAAIIIPQTINSGTEFIKVERAGKTFYYTLKNNQTFQSGNAYSYTLTLKEKEEELILTSSTEGNILPWDQTNNYEQGNAVEEISSYYSNGIAYIANGGELSFIIPENEKSYITSLQISGYLNGTDIKFLREQLSHLENLNLKEANIIEGGESYYTNSKNESYYTSNNIFPKYFLSSSNLGSSLKSIQLPNSVIEIDQHAFLQYTTTGNPTTTFPLNQIVLGENLTKIGMAAFGCSIENIHIPKHVTIIGTAAFGFCPNLKSITVEESNKMYISVNGVIYENTNTRVDWEDNPEYTMLNVCPPAIESFSFPNNLTITAINSRAFSDCKYITSIIIPNSVTKIGSCPFARCTSLKVVKIPSSVTEKPYDCFYCNDAMEILYLGHTTPPSWYFETGNTADYKLPTTCKLYVPNTDDWKYSSTNLNNWDKWFTIVRE